MKIYKHDLYPDVLLLIYPKWGKLIGVPYNYNSISSRWEICGLGTALYYYSQEKLDMMECVGDTEEDWDLVIKNGLNDSYLIHKENNNDR